MNEASLLQLILPKLPPGVGTLVGPGDDAALLALDERQVLVCTDVLVEGVHFNNEWSSGADVGWRAAMANLADIAAMGGRATALVVAVTVPGTTKAAWFGQLAEGLALACAPLGVGVVGGDLAAGPGLIVAVTALGQMAGAAPVKRSGARPGDVVALAGRTGYAAAGLACLESDPAIDSTTEPDGQVAAADQRGDPAKGAAFLPFDPASGALDSLAAEAVQVYLRPNPPIEAGPVAAQAGATAMIDISDGLLLDAGRVAHASGLDLVLDPARPALASPTQQLAPLAKRLGTNSLEWVLTGGEDHALLATFPAQLDLPEGWVGIGQCKEGTDQVKVLGDFQPARQGWDHFGS
ncbi:MAG: thiamine-phosphate kinase [Micrococcales bacterium]|nr:thiamine-phosphate kinase [Micrococcales bacterium]